MARPRMGRPGRLDALPGHVPHPLRTHDDLSARQPPAGGLNPRPHRTALPRRVFRRFGALTAEVLVAGHRAHRHRSRAAMAGGCHARPRPATVITRLTSEESLVRN